MAITLEEAGLSATGDPQPGDEDDVAYLAKPGYTQQLKRGVNGSGYRNEDGTGGLEEFTRLKQVLVSLS
jgi:hypothetical protein